MRAVIEHPKHNISPCPFEFHIDSEGRCSLNVLLQIETLGDAYTHSWRISVRCAAVQKAEYQGRPTSEVNAERVPGAELVKAFNQLPLKVLASPLPDDPGRRVVFVSSDRLSEPQSYSVTE
jgi:hypothetical protein